MTKCTYLISVMQTCRAIFEVKNNYITAHEWKIHEAAMWFSTGISYARSINLTDNGKAKLFVIS